MMSVDDLPEFTQHLAELESSTPGSTQRQKLSDSQMARTGRPKKLSDWEEREIVKMSKSDPSRSAPSIQYHINQQRIDPVGLTTVKRVLRSHGLLGRRPVHKPFVSPKNTKERLKFAQDHAHWSVKDWSRVLWTDESKFMMFSDGVHWIRRERGTRYAKRNMIPTVKHGGGSVMVWGGFVGTKVTPLVRIEGRMNAQYYINNVIDNVLRPWTRDHCPAGWIFQQDNDPKHKSRLATAFFKTHRFRMLKWPAQSADLSPIENLWENLDRDVRKSKPKNQAEKFALLSDAWANTDKKMLKSLIASMPRRIHAVIVARGVTSIDIIQQVFTHTHPPGVRYSSECGEFIFKRMLEAYFVERMDILLDAFTIFDSLAKFPPNECDKIFGTPLCPDAMLAVRMGIDRLPEGNRGGMRLSKFLCDIMKYVSPPSLEYLLDHGLVYSYMLQDDRYDFATSNLISKYASAFARKLIDSREQNSNISTDSDAEKINSFHVPRLNFDYINLIARPSKYWQRPPTYYQLIEECEEF